MATKTILKVVCGSSAPVGMKESEWEDPFEKGGPQDLLDQLVSSGFPWGMLGKEKRLVFYEPAEAY